jgi:DNA-directed RNA polymerase I, II, and III subunit RPABC5
MIIPVKCFTCGAVLADKYVKYIDMVKSKPTDIPYFTPLSNERTIEGKAMDKLGIKKICCRRHIQSHVDIE